MKRKIKGLNTLEKINKHKLDQLRISLSQLRDRDDVLQKLFVQLQQQELVEKSISSDNHQWGQTLNAFMQKNNHQQQAITQERTQLKGEMEIILEEIRELYQDGKRLESVIKTTNQEIKRDELRLEQKVMDELSIRAFTNESF